MSRTAPSYVEQADEALMALYAHGDHQAFSVLYGRHEMAVWRYLFRAVREQATSDDLQQDIWFAVARQANTYRPTARFTTWLFTLAHNRLVDHWRTAKNHVSLDDDDNAEGERVLDTVVANSGYGPLRQLESREQALALMAAIEELPPVQREAFLLQAEADLSVQDIALVTGVSFETAKSRLRYARNTLRELIEEFT